MPGELTLLMGPSGSGKTTLLSILGCILSPTSGEVKIAGHSTAGLGPEELAELRRKHIGFIFQSYNLFPTLNAVENVRIALDVLGRRATRGGAGGGSCCASSDSGTGCRIIRAICRAVSSSASPWRARSRPRLRLCSRTSRQRPSTAKNGHAVMALLARIAKEQHRSVLAVTHDPRTLGYADRVVRIEDGKIVGEERRRRA